MEFLEHVKKHVMFNSKEEEHLSIPIFSYLRPTISVSFLPHIVLSMGRYQTEIHLLTHASLTECFR